MANPGCGLESVGRLEEAEALFRQSLEARRRGLGDEHIETLWGEGYPGWRMCHKGDCAEAEKLLRHRSRRSGSATVLTRQSAHSRCRSRQKPWNWADSSMV
jgi:hypothetical protein